MSLLIITKWVGESGSKEKVASVETTGTTEKVIKSSSLLHLRDSSNKDERQTKHTRSSQGETLGAGIEARGVGESKRRQARLEN